jgi:DNA repair exonuclease SbcCD ATPase subunit
MPSATNTLASAQQQLDQSAAVIQQIIGQRALIEASLGKAQAAVDAAHTADAELGEVLSLLHSMEQEWRERFQAGLASVVSDGLSSVFGERIDVRLETTTFRETTSINLLVEQGGVTTDIMDAKGGSLVQILSFLLRVQLLVSVQPPLRRVMLLDEPFGMVSADLFPRLCELITGLNRRFGIQFVINSHNEELLHCADASYMVSQVNGQAVARMLQYKDDEAVL